MAISTSRIFIRNLPPSLTDDDFRSHFSRAANDVTDAKLFRHRRFGYVGYKTPAEAQSAVRYFNKSFIRMSRINVELAIPVAEKPDGSGRGEKLDGGEVKKKEDESKKRKRDDAEPALKDSEKLQEFLGVMQAQKAKTWQNDATGGVETRVMQASKTADDSDEDMQVIGVIRGEQEEEEMVPASPSKHKDPNLTDDAWMKSRKNEMLDENGEILAAQVEAAEETPETRYQGDLETKNIPATASNAEALEPRDKIRLLKRLYLRNLPFNTTEGDVAQKFGEFGDLVEVHMPLSSSSGKGRGYAFLLYENGSHAVKAWEKMNGSTFQGRLIHIVPAEPKNDEALDEFSLSQLPLKQRMMIKRKRESSAATYKWNPLYMNMDDVMSSTAARLGISKSEILDPTSADAAIKQALAETQIIQDSKNYFAKNGVDLDSFKPGKPRGDTGILVKNFPHCTTADEIRKLFSPHGEIVRLLIPPSGTMALINFSNASEGRAAFNALKYKRVGETILFLEKAPKGIFTSPANEQVAEDGPAKISTSDLLQPGFGGETHTLFVKNLSFSTNTESFRSAFEHISGFVSARVKTKPNPKNVAAPLSLGFGFVEFNSSDAAETAMKLMNGSLLNDFKLDVRLSQKALDVGEQKRKENRAKAIAATQTKVVVKNLPFEANKKDVRTLLASYGRVKSVRLPKKFDSSSRGFAFAEFTTPKEASNAMEALRNSHLLGRRLHIEYASAADLDPEAEIERMQQKVGLQVNKVAMQRLGNSERRKFAIEGGVEDTA